MEGQIIDQKYRILELLGQGGMGAVYAARHLTTGRRVAVKVIVSDLVKGGQVLARFEREVRASGVIESQHVVQVLDAGIDPATRNPYMVMEHLSGTDLHQRIESGGAVSHEVALRIVGQCCLGLERAHQEGIVHRDIKSANIFLARREGAEIVAKLLDFGIAKVRADPFGSGADHGLTRTGAMMGSPLYMSPEQAMGQKDLDSRTDIFSLGVVLYEALAGVAPNAECETLGQLIMAICSGKLAPLEQRAPTVTPELLGIVRKAMANAPSDRFQTAAEMHAAILALLPSGDLRLTEIMLRPERSKPMDAPTTSSAGSVTESAETNAALPVAAPATGPPPTPAPNTSTAFAATTASGTTHNTVSAASAADQDRPSPGRRASRLWIVPALGVLATAGGIAMWVATKASHVAPSATPSSTVTIVTSAASAPSPLLLSTATLASAAPNHEGQVTTAPAVDASSPRVKEPSPPAGAPHAASASAPRSQAAPHPSASTNHSETHPVDPGTKTPTTPTADRNM